MNRFARPENFAHPVRTPLLRKHFVYRAFDADDQLLYVGCTHDLTKRMAAHRTQADWAGDFDHLFVVGPHNYETARELERVAIATERPLYNFTPERRGWKRIWRRVFERAFTRISNQDPMRDWSERVRLASAHADAVIAYPGNRGPAFITDFTIPSALRAESLDLKRGAA